MSNYKDITKNLSPPFQVYGRGQVSTKLMYDLQVVYILLSDTLPARRTFKVKGSNFRDMVTEAFGLQLVCLPHPYDSTITWIIIRSRRSLRYFVEVIIQNYLSSIICYLIWRCRCTRLFYNTNTYNPCSTFAWQIKICSEENFYRG